MNNTVTVTANDTQEANTTQRTPEYIKFWDVASYVETEGVAFDKAAVLLDDVIDFLTPLARAVEDRDKANTLSLVTSVNSALQKAFILEDVISDMHEQNYAFLADLFSEDDPNEAQKALIAALVGMMNDTNDLKRLYRYANKLFCSK